MDTFINVLVFVFIISLVVFSVWFNIRKLKNNGGGCGCCGGKCSCQHDCNHKCEHK